MNMDVKNMTRSQVWAMYEKEMAQIKASGEHPQATGMASNEMRRWLDRSLDQALPDPEPTTSTLGERLRQNIAQAEQVRLDREQRALREARERQARHAREISIVFDTLKSKITNSIQEGAIPAPMRIPRSLDNPSRSYEVPINSTGHADYGQYKEDMETWAQQQGLKLEVVHDHDGMGIESWWNLVVKPL